jgi:hypothetical protein
MALGCDLEEEFDSADEFVAWVKNDAYEFTDVYESKSYISSIKI